MNKKSLEWTFDTVASLYEKFRPGYTDMLYKEIFEYKNINERSNVLEIGIGGAQATKPVLRTGCKFTAVECGEEFSRLCRKKFKDFSSFSVITGKFEDIDFKSNSFDFVFSASAFHWIAEVEGYKKVFSILKKEGLLRDLQIIRL